MMTAKEMNARMMAGLQMCGQNEDGELEWLGTVQEWQLSEKILDAMEEEHIDTPDTSVSLSTPPPPAPR
jgi:hypothetical protein